MHSSRQSACRSEKLYRTLWRWHLYAGVCLAPILLWASITGALYVFVDEVEPWLYRSLYYAEGTASQPHPIDQSIQLATAAHPDEKFLGVGVFADPSRSVEVMTRSEETGLRHVYVNQYTGQVLGSRLHESGFFPVVRQLHRSLFLGAFGRWVIETATSFGILLLATGVYLWWPRRGNHRLGVWIPRLSGPPRQVLRDLHAVIGIFSLPLAMLILITGLFFSLLWGGAYLLVLFVSGQAPAAYTFHAETAGTASGQSISYQQVLEIARQTDPGVYPISISPPDDFDSVGGGYQVEVGAADNPSQRAIYRVDSFSGEVLARTDPSNASWLLTALALAYPLHVGSVFGLPTKILAVLACLGLIVVICTGFSMWWRAKPRGLLGFPERSDGYRLTPVAWCLLLVGAVALPTVAIGIATAVCLDSVLRWTAGALRPGQPPGGR